MLEVFNGEQKNAKPDEHNILSDSSIRGLLWGYDSGYMNKIYIQKTCK